MPVQEHRGRGTKHFFTYRTFHLPGGFHFVVPTLLSIPGAGLPLGVRPAELTTFSAGRLGAAGEPAGLAAFSGALLQLRRTDAAGFGTAGDAFALGAAFGFAFGVTGFVGFAFAGFGAFVAFFALGLNSSSEKLLSSPLSSDSSEPEPPSAAHSSSFSSASEKQPSNAYKRSRRGISIDGICQNEV